MDTAVWRRVKSIASLALEQPEAERDAYIRAACAGEEALRREVQSLVRSTVKAAHHFETPATIGAYIALAVDARVGPYRVVRELGSGGMGSVFLAERNDGEFEQRVAIKVVRDGGLGGAFLAQRFREERRILASLDHPHIARLLDGGTTADGLPYVAMEYVEGSPLDSFCRTRRLGLRERLAIFRDVCAAVHYAHQRLVIHRDIKAANILVTADGVPKLLDFGIAKLLAPGLSASEQAVTMYRVMTPESASPEQLKGEPITIAADGYALGVLLFRLLTGRSPYGEALASEADLVRAVCETTPEPPSAVVRRGLGDDNSIDTIPADLDVIVMKALRKEPERRYGSVEQLSGDIARFLDGRPVLAARDTVRYRAGKFVRRHRVAMSAVLALAIALVAGIAATLWQAHVARRERARAEQEFAAVRSLANGVLGELYDSVARLQGSMGAREILLRRASEYLDTLTTVVGDNIDLRRETANGYIRLAKIQGATGLENFGDTASARRNFLKAAALLQPVAGLGRGDPRDRTTLADVVLQLSDLEPDRQARWADLQRAQTLIESLPADTDSRQREEMLLWFDVANYFVDVKDYERTKAAAEKEVRAAEALFRAAPDSLTASSNLSICYKHLGAVLRELHSPAEALVLVEKAMALDKARVAREPARAIWRLQLSFAVASIAEIRLDEGNLGSALEGYGQAVELRQAAVAAEPNDVFASESLARGYGSMAKVLTRMGRVSEGIDWRARRIAVYRDRLSAHPERDSAWREYASAISDATDATLDALESLPSTAAVRAQGTRRVREMLDSLTALSARWTSEHRPGTNPVLSDQLARSLDRLQRLSGGQ